MGVCVGVDVGEEVNVIVGVCVGVGVGGIIDSAPKPIFGTTLTTVPPLDMEIGFSKDSAHIGYPKLSFSKGTEVQLT